MRHFSFLTNYGSSVPLTYKDAVNSADSEKWETAMKSEMTSLQKHGTWSLQKLPPGRKAVENKWVFTLKKDRDGKVIKHKARLVAKGYTQREGIDYKQTFAPVIRYESLRLLLALAAQFCLTLTQFDVSTAFLHGELEEIYLTQPEGFDDGTKRVCRLHKGLYGLRQSPRTWNEHVDKTLRGAGLKQLKSDPCVYVDSHPSHRLILSLWVDDGMIFSDSQERTENVLKNLRKNYDITLSVPNKSTLR